MDQEVKTKVKGLGYGVVGLIVLMFILGTFTIVSAGERGVVLRLGKVNRTLEPGLHFKLPLFESVSKLDVQTQKEQVKASAASQDLQNVTAEVAMNYNLYPDKVSSLWTNIGEDYKERVIDPAIQEAIKASTANYTAEELVTKRETVRDEIERRLVERLSREFVNVTAVSIVDFDFSPSFNAAIEAKVTAEQNALAAKNKLEQVKFEADQRVASAKGEAEAIRIQAQAIQNQGGAEYVRLKTIEKWNGVLPQNLYGSAPIPFLNTTN